MVQISQRDRAYLETARTLLRAAQTMTDSAIASQLKTLSEDYARRAEKSLSAHGVQGYQDHPGTIMNFSPTPVVTSFLILRYRLQSFKAGGKYYIWME
jgi:hypothetical protein